MELAVQANTPEGKTSTELRSRHLRRWEASEYLDKRHGIKLATTTLARLACVSSDGPPFYKAGGRPLYPVDELDRWALARLGQLVRSTSEVRRG